MGAGAALGLIVDSKQTSYRDIFKVLQRLLRNPDSTEFVYAPLTRAGAHAVVRSLNRSNRTAHARTRGMHDTG